MLSFAAIGTPLTRYYLAPATNTNPAARRYRSTGVVGDLIISGLKDKRCAVAGKIVELRGQIDRLQADLFQLDAVLKLYGLSLPGSCSLLQQSPS